MTIERLAKRLAAYSTVDARMRKLTQNAITLSFRNEPVLVTGDTGTGKEVIATILHGTREDNITTINTTAVTDTLFESELFGHVKGSYTGAYCDREGLVASAGGGTLFLDEIGDMPVTLQAKILRLIQFGTYRNVGSDKIRIAKCRIIAATCKNIPRLIKDKMFREDLYYRLSTFTLHLTPLHDRRHDIHHYLTNHKLWNKMPESDRKHFTTYADNESIYGNYRELEQIMLRYEVLEELPELSYVLKNKVLESS
jgi:transcriptional regulator with PAS, ATPase and Fis domain|tara:strand:- start:1102 stop:1863 length:762 start_codon:yes stop_codon:yes gene_type:complete